MRFPVVLIETAPTLANIDPTHSTLIPVTKTMRHRLNALTRGCASDEAVAAMWPVEMLALWDFGDEISGSFQGFDGRFYFRSITHTLSISYTSTVRAELGEG